MRGFGVCRGALSADRATDLLLTTIISPNMSGLADDLLNDLEGLSDDEQHDEEQEMQTVEAAGSSKDLKRKADDAEPELLSLLPDSARSLITAKTSALHTAKKAKVEAPKKKSLGIVVKKGKAKA